ncbi:HK97 family phage prohead protease [Nocardia sp. NPDC051750]|uniref:HK97 family phage prohead protease n=1 Tax=Nocardia sp. NPDC051750 TaxID=3364325 RepID=UPI0037946E7A
MSDLIHYRFTTVGAVKGRTIHGVAVPYGEVATVRDGYGQPYQERFAHGAFTRTLQERSHKIRLLGMHDGRSFPIGRLTTAQETSRGLEVAFAVSDTTAGNDALALIRDGSVTGLSIGFMPVRSRVVDGVVERLEVSLREVSLVTEPAYQGAQVAGIRSKPEAEYVITNARARRTFTALFDI